MGKMLDSCGCWNAHLEVAMRALLRARPPGFQDSAVNIYFFRFSRVGGI